MTLYIDTILPQAIVSDDITICLGESTSLSVSGGSSYSWTPVLSLNNPADSMPVATPQQTMTYNVSSTNSCGTEYDSVVVTVYQINATIVNDSAV